MATIACLMVVAAGAQAARAMGASRIAPSQELVAVLARHGARNRPSSIGKLVAVVTATRPITGERTVMPVLAQTIDRQGRFWLRVRLPVAPWEASRRPEPVGSALGTR